LDELLKLGNRPQECAIQPPDLAFAGELGIEDLIKYNTVHVEEEDETVEITFEEQGTTEAMKEKIIRRQTQQQMKHRKLTV
jgi:hypothetical protein